MVHSENRELGHRRSDLPHPGCIRMGSPVAGEVRWREATKTDHERSTGLCLLHDFYSCSRCFLPSSIMLGHKKHDQEFENGCYSTSSGTFQSFVVKVKERKRSWIRRINRLRLFGFDGPLYFAWGWMGREASRACHHSSQLQGRLGHTERNVGRSSMPPASKLILWSKINQLEIWMRG